MFEHWSVFFIQHIFPHLQHIVRPDADNRSVKGGVVNLAQSSPLGTSGNPSGPKYGAICAAIAWCRGSWVVSVSRSSI
ncbi:MAG: hypothetical protein KGI32_10750, partial [Gammaproteobacteria bacterium]|nr:hypothetical protein [Gammaproteobacteria bacterium]